MTELLLRCFSLGPVSRAARAGSSGPARNFKQTEVLSPTEKVRHPGAGSGHGKGTKQQSRWAVTPFMQTTNLADVKTAAQIVLHKGYSRPLCQQQEIYKQQQLWWKYTAWRTPPCRHNKKTTTKKKKLGWIKLTIHKSFLIRAASVLPQFFY